MKIETKLLVHYAIRLIFLFFAAWVAVAPDALPGAHVVTRVGFVVIFLAFSILVGEIARLRTQFEMLMRALRAATRKESGSVAAQEAVPILIRALASREEATRQKAHRNLVRLTGQDLPPERTAWEAWWAQEKR
ncbi:MAG: hypothetical protein ACC662_11870 [Planctomycetota bacterium]